MKYENAVYMQVVYTVKHDKSWEFYSRISEEGIEDASRMEKGNLRYEYFFSPEDDDRVLLLEAWTDRAAQQAHLSTDHYEKLQDIKSEFVLSVAVEEFTKCS